MISCKFIHVWGVGEVIRFGDRFSFITAITATNRRLFMEINGSTYFECDGVLFDLDEVLIDSTGNIMRHWQVWADRNSIDINEINRVAHGLRTIETMRLVAPHLDSEKEAYLFFETELEDTSGIVAIEGAKEILSRLPANAWAIVTSGCLELVKVRLAKAGLPFPKFLVTADDVRDGKPSPEPYLAGAKRLGLDPRLCIVIEDAPAGVEAGKKAGMRVIGITSTNSRDALLEKGADLILENLADLEIRELQNGDRLLGVSVKKTR
jgi:mannitol-1-/sugar-/sorbitol-6-phosphatase